MGEVSDLGAWRRQKSAPLGQIIDTVRHIERDPVLELELGERAMIEILRETYGTESAIRLRTQEFRPAPITGLDVDL